MKSVIRLRCRNTGSTIEAPVGSTLAEIFRLTEIEMNHGPVCARVNNKVEGMHYRVYNNKDVEFLDMTSGSGSRNYARSLFFVFCKAVHDLYTGAELAIDIPVSNGYYVDLHIDHAVTADDAERIRRRMQQIIDDRLPITRHQVPTEDAIRMFEEKGDE